MLAILAEQFGLHIGISFINANMKTSLVRIQTALCRLFVCLSDSLEQHTAGW